MGGSSSDSDSSGSSSGSSSSSGGKRRFGKMSKFGKAKSHKHRSALDIYMEHLDKKAPAQPSDQTSASEQPMDESNSAQVRQAASVSADGNEELNRISVVPNRSDRLQVVLAAETPGAKPIRYEFDRYCPHKGADLLKASVMQGQIQCPKHRWRFDLPHGGHCADHGCTINAAVLDW